MTGRLVAPMVCALLGASTLCAAQAPAPGRAYRGLFGADRSGWDQSLVATAALGWGWDSNLIAGGRGNSTVPNPSDFLTQFQGGLGEVSASASYALDRDLLDIDASAGTSGRYYPTLANRLLARKAARLAATVTPLSWLSARAFVSYAPVSLWTLFVPLLDDGLASLAEPADLELASSLTHFTAYGGNVGARHRFSQRVSGSLNYGYRERAAASQLDLTRTHSGGASLRYTVGRGLDLKAGYRHSVTRRTGLVGDTLNRTIDAGVDYRRSLSFSRRTTLGFSTGSTITSRPGGRAGERPTWRATGNAALRHEIGRSWLAMLTYARTTRFDDAWSDPVFSDAAAAILQGFLGRRIQVQSALRSSWGQIGFSSTGTHYESYVATTGLGVALSRYANLTANYSYYLHRFGASVLLPPGVPRDVGRHSVMGRVTLSAPVLHRTRRPHAAG